MILEVQPGLFIWTVIIFLVFFFILRRFAWKPILEALKKREATIEESLQEARNAREEMEKLKADNEALLKEARQERDKIIREANSMRDKIVADAKNAAAEAQAKEVEKARQLIKAQENEALANIKDTAANIAVEVAERILRDNFADRSAQEAMAKKLVSELSNN